MNVDSPECLVKFDKKHGGAWDRGSADSYYNRPRLPHMYPNGTYNEPKITIGQMTEEEIRAYNAGYDFNEDFGDKKIWD